jgi:predicted kinase
MFLHLGPAPAQMRTRELAMPAAVVEILDGTDLPRLTAALEAEARPAGPSGLRVLRRTGPVLVVLVGPAGSGKSTWARTHFAPTEVVSSDQMRAWVADDESDQTATADATAVLHQLVTIRLSRGLRTVVDATNVRRTHRAPLLAIAAAHQVAAHAVVVTTPLHVCRARNATRPAVPRPGRRYARRVPDAVLTAQHAAAAAAAPVLATEGFAGVELVDLSGGPARIGEAGRAC